MTYTPAAEGTGDTQWRRIGQRLREERLRLNLSQEALADLVGAGVRSIRRWERGEAFPYPYSREKLCQLFQTDAHTLFEPGRDEGQRPNHIPMLDIPNASLPVPDQHMPLWHVPYPHNSFFTGRDTILQSLHEMLRQNVATALTQSYALHGLGGIGKTQIALEYVYRYASAYTAIFWISAETSETLLSSFVTLAEVLNLVEQHEQDQHKIVRAITQWLDVQKGWLLVFDNVEDLDLLQPFLPSARQGSLLLTTRLQALGTIAQQIAVKPMDAEEGLLFLLQRARLLRPGASPTDLLLTEVLAAQAIIEAMDGLPLALDHAGAYIEETQCSLDNYLQQYCQRRSRLLGRRGRHGQDHPASVETTLSLSFQQVTQQHPVATEVVQLCAFLAPNAIPEKLLAAGFPSGSEQLQTITADPLFLDEVIAVLGMYSLVRRDPIMKTLSIHRLVQAVLQDRLSIQEQEEWVKRVITALYRIFPEVKLATWSQCEQLVPHVLQCASYTASWEQANEELATLLFKTGKYFIERAQYQKAESVLKRALRLRELTLGVEHLDGAEVLRHLSILYCIQGKYTEAEPLLKRVLGIRELALGVEHPEVAYPLTTLGSLYSEQGKYVEAELLLKRALRIRELALGIEHPEVANTLHNLGLLYRRQGNYAKAEPVLKRALQIWELVSGAMHPDVAYPLNTLGEIYVAQAKYVEAELVLKRALQIWETTLGAEHPQVAAPLTKLGKLYCKQGKYEEAEPLLQRALSMSKQALGSDHPDVAESQLALARLSLGQCNPLKAQHYYQQALATLEKTLGLDHPQVVNSIEEYAQLVREQSRDV